MTNSRRLLSLDTETTGLSVSDGDRIIEIGIVEYEGLTATGKVFHCYLNPGDRIITAGATAIHGITNEQLRDKPSFAQIADDFLDFIGDSPIVIYNAGFDLGFIQAELERVSRAMIENEIIDGMLIARKRFPRKKLTLDAIAKRLDVDTSARSLHGALIDARILGDVYRKLTQQDELAIASVATAVIAPEISVQNRKPLLRAPGQLTEPALLRAETSYSLFSSALMPESLVTTAVECGWAKVGITDRNTTAAAMSFAGATSKAEVHPLIGVTLPLQNSEGKPIVLYARNAEGWKNIQTLVTINNVTNRGKGLTSSQLRDHKDGIACLTGGSEGALAHILRTQDAETALKVARYLAALFSEAFAIEISRHGGRNEAHIENGLIAIAHELRVPVVATSIARAEPGKAFMVEVLHAIGEGHEYHPEDCNDEHVRTVDEFNRLFKDMPEAVENTGWFAGLCDFSPQGAKPMLPRYETPSGEEEPVALARLAEAGLAERLKKIPSEKHNAYRARFDYEMKLIVGQGFAGYFLIVADFIGWARQHNIPVGPGRGSGAGSIVAWCLGITKLDPIELNLLFERFINPDRVSLPDFDIDFCESRREEVIRYVREHYGSDRVVAIGTYGTFGARQAVKDAGRILGLSYGQMDRIAKLLPDKGGLSPRDLETDEVRAAVSSPETREALDIALKLAGLVRNKGKHAAGIVISDKPVTEITALEPDPKRPEQAVTQYDMKPVEKAGLVKFDFLGLSNLTVIERCRQNLEKLGITIDPYDLPLDDKATYESLSQGFTVGVFQLESPGITRACRDIRVDNFEDLVAIVALYRPGPMEFIPLYARRKKGLEPFGTPHPLLDNVTKDTFGILVYQEQVMQAAQVLAGYSLGQADLLRRAMGKKIQSEMDAQRNTFVKGCEEINGIPAAQANDLFDIIDKFAGYGFNRSHAAAYALISYITAYLKTNFPSAYLAAAMDVSADDTDHLVLLAHEARRLGITFEAPKPEEGAEHFRVIEDKKIGWSLRAIKGIGSAVIDSIIAAARKGAFSSFKDFVDRVGDGINKSQIVQLAAAGVLDGFCEGRSSAIAQAKSSFEGLAEEAKAKRAGQNSLFDDHFLNETPMPAAMVEMDSNEILSLERQALGLTISAHPLDAHLKTMEAAGYLTPSMATRLLDTMPVTVAALIDEVKINKGKGGWMTVRISDEKCNLVLGCAEDLPRAHMLAEGQIMILRINAYVTGGERRVRVDEIVGPIADVDPCALAVLEVDESFKRSDLRKVLSNLEKGNHKLKVQGEKESVITPPIVNLSPEAVNALKAIDGVIDLRI